MRTFSLTIAAAVFVSAAAFGCGGSDDSSEQAKPSTQAEETASAPKEQGGQRPKQGSSSQTAKEQDALPADLSPQVARQVEVLREQFPKPKPSKTIKGSAAAIAAGEDACRGKTPMEVWEEFKSQSKLDPDQEELVAELPKYEEEASKDSSYVAGQLAAVVYEMTLPKDIAQAGFQGCVFVLARGLEREIVN